jgi:hypothetical protein
MIALIMSGLPEIKMTTTGRPACFKFLIRLISDNVKFKLILSPTSSAYGSYPITASATSAVVSLTKAFSE